MGYGIRYEFGIFDQQPIDGWQREVTDKWLRFGNPWEIARPEIEYMVQFGGRTEGCSDDAGRYRMRWIPDAWSRAWAYDTPMLGYGVNTCNPLRLWKAEAVEAFDFAAFNVGNYYGAVEDKVASENITKVLYPNDESAQGKALRLEQQYLLRVVLAAGHDPHHCIARGGPLDNFYEKCAIQLNDTHPAIAMPELMRLLMDEHEMEWDEAWAITTKDLRLHQPHVAARSAGDLAADAVRAAAAAAPRDHLRDQPALPRRGAL